MGEEKNEEQKPRTRRHSLKPIMEKKRRARINKALATLENMLKEYYRKKYPDGVPFTGKRKNKLEKADILEQIVEYISKLDHTSENAQSSGNSPAPSANNAERDEEAFHEGYYNCISDVTQFYDQIRHPVITPKNYSKLLHHLREHVQTIFPIESQKCESHECEAMDLSAVSNCGSLSPTLQNSTNPCSSGADTPHWPNRNILLISPCSVSSTTSDNKTLKEIWRPWPTK